MRLSSHADYSLRTLIYAALQAPETVSIDEVAEAYGISRNHLMKVVQKLGKLGFLHTQRGRSGGFTLGRKPGEIRLGDVVRKTEPSLSVVECFDPETNTCRIDGNCRLKGILKSASEAFFDTLDEYTLADLLKQPSRLKAALGV